MIAIILAILIIVESFFNKVISLCYSKLKKVKAFSNCYSRNEFTAYSSVAMMSKYEVMNISKIIEHINKKSEYVVKDNRRTRPVPIANSNEGQEIVNETNFQNQKKLFENENFGFSQNTNSLKNLNIDKEQYLILKELLKNTFSEEKIKVKSSKSESKHFQRNIQESLLLVNDVNSLVKSLKLYSQSYKRSCVLNKTIYEELIQFTMKFGILNWTAALISEMEEKDYAISFNIVNEFLQMTYIKNLFRNYYENSDEEDNSGDADKNSKDNCKYTDRKIVKYIKKLNSKAQEFKPSHKANSLSVDNKSSKYNNILVDESNNIFYYKKKLRCPSDVPEFKKNEDLLANSKTCKLSLKEKIGKKDPKDFVPYEKPKNDKYNLQSQAEHLQMKYVGTGHSDLTKWEWGTNMLRDSLTSHVGHPSRMLYMSLGENESTARMKYKFINVNLQIIKRMVQPAGPMPEKKKDMI